jgi:mRNA-degrading endonuclease YafQ of YafQ-DinJ toxin-antitoxin module
MPYKIVYTKTYNRIAAKYLKRHPEIESQYRKTLMLLEINPHHPSLRLHKLKGKFKSLYSVSINIRYRLVILFVIEEKQIIPITVGSHDEVYG